MSVWSMDSGIVLGWVVRDNGVVVYWHRLDRFRIRWPVIPAAVRPQ